MEVEMVAEQAAGPEPRDRDVVGYEPPRVVRLGSLAELTRGGALGPDDGLGGAGDDGSL